MHIVQTVIYTIATNGGHQLFLDADSYPLYTALVSDSRWTGNQTKFLRHEHECLTKLLELAFFEPNLIQQIQLVEVG